MAVKMRKWQLISVALVALFGLSYAAYFFYFTANGYHYSPMIYENTPFAGALHRSVTDRVKTRTNAQLYVWLRNLPDRLHLEAAGVEIVSAEITRTASFLERSSGYKWLMVVEANIDADRDGVQIALNEDLSILAERSPTLFLIGNTSLDTDATIYSNHWWLVNWDSARQSAPGRWMPNSHTLTALPEPAWPQRIPSGYDGYLWVRREDGTWASVAGAFGS